jgi:hypothetical protein
MSPFRKDSHAHRPLALEHGIEVDDALEISEQTEI